MDFTYGEYIGFVRDTAPTKFFFITHPILISPQKAVQLAELEAQDKIKASYYITLTSPFYNALDKENLERFRMIKEMGHDLGLYFDISVKGTDPDTEMAEIMTQLSILQHHLGEFPVESVLFYNRKMPDYEVIKMLDQERVYCPDFDQRFQYIGDTDHIWNEDPTQGVKHHDRIRLNITPEWYNDKPTSITMALVSIGLSLDMDKKLLREINKYETV